MKFIVTKIDLEEYIKKVERQKEVLKLSLLFSDEEKEKITECFDELIEICNVRMAVKAISNLEEIETIWRKWPTNMG
jgi:hypothetical protein